LPIGSYPEITVRHLLYHIYAPSRSTAWKANIRQLTHRWHVFTGRKIIAIATDSQSVPASEIQAYITNRVGDSIEWIVLPNNRELREAATFPSLLSRVATTDEHAAMFFAHTKGVDPYGKNPERGIVYWRNALYHYLLDDPNKIDRLLTRYPCVGGCKIVWRHEGTTPRLSAGLVDRGHGPSPYPSGLFHGTWMFAGTFWWARCDQVFSHPSWSLVPRDHYGAEAYLSGLFRDSQACSVYQPWPENMMPAGSAYNPKHHRNKIEDSPE